MIKRGSADYALVEYGIAPEEMKSIERNLLKKARRDKGKEWDGTAKGLWHEVRALLKENI